ncbi:MAG: hypothetical protein TYPL_4400 [Candidatus Tyloplasma litorale]|nr:MAG: hypothetical protein TYPL_4400 [Mycoplasmatales bacterium]
MLKKNKENHLAIISLSSLGDFYNVFSEIVGVLGTFNSLTKSNGNIFTKILYCPIDKLSDIEKKLLKVNNIVYLEYKKNDLFEKIIKLNNSRFTGILNSFHQPIEILKEKTYKTITFLENDLIINNNLELSDSKIVLHGGQRKKYSFLSNIDKKILNFINFKGKEIFFTNQCIFTIPNIFYKNFINEYENVYKLIGKNKILDSIQASSYYDHFSIIMLVISHNLNIEIIVPDSSHLLEFFDPFLSKNSNIKERINNANIHRNNSSLIIKEFNSSKIISKNNFEKRFKNMEIIINKQYLENLIEGTTYLRYFYINILEKTFKKIYNKELKSAIDLFKITSLKSLEYDLNLINLKIQECFNNKQISNKKKILITGCDGYIATNIAYIMTNEYEIFGIDNNINSFKKENSFFSRKFTCDIRDEKKLNEIFSKIKFDLIIHLAGLISVPESFLKKEEYFDVNYNGTVNLIKIAKKYNVKNIIFSSTAAVYGISTKLPIYENHNTSPINPYGKSKLMAEREIINSGMKYFILRYFNVAGACSEETRYNPKENFSHLIPLINDAFINEKKFYIFGNDYKTKDGTCVRDYVHVCDLSNVHLLLTEKIFENNTSSEIFNISSDKGFSVKEVYEAACKVHNKRIKVEIADRRKGDPDALYSSSDKIRRIYGWKPKFSLEEMILSDFKKINKN